MAPTASCATSSATASTPPSSTATSAQNARQKALNGFRDGSVRILVATDIAARGIDVPGISHVVNFDLPDEAESYVHRIGRTGRNGADGIAITLCDPSENSKLRSVERIIRMKLPVTADHTGEPDPARDPKERNERVQEAANDRGGHRNGNRPRGDTEAFARASPAAAGTMAASAASAATGRLAQPDFPQLRQCDAAAERPRRFCLRAIARMARKARLCEAERAAQRLTAEATCAGKMRGLKTAS